MGKTRNYGFKVWIICQNCRQEFLVNVYRQETARFCNARCKLEHLRQDPEFREKQSKAVSMFLKNKWRDPEFSQKIKDAAVKTCRDILNSEPDIIKKRRKASSETMTKLHQDPEFTKRHAERSSKRLKEQHRDVRLKEIFVQNIINYNKSEKHRQTSSENMKKLNKDPEFKERARSNIVKYNFEHAGETMIENMRTGKFGYAQKYLYESLLERFPRLSPFLVMEKAVSLDPDVVKRYPGSNKCFYLVDIALVINGTVRVAVEVDGKLGHSTKEDIMSDQVRDRVMLDEFGIRTIRVTNGQAIKDKDLPDTIADVMEGYLS